MILCGWNFSLYAKSNEKKGTSYMWTVTSIYKKKKNSNTNIQALKISLQPRKTLKTSVI